MIEIPSLAELKVRMAHNVKDAAQIICASFYTRLITVVRAKMAPKIRAKFDPEEVVQSALGSFCRRQAAGAYPNLNSWDELWAILLTIAEHKCADRWDYYRAERRDVNREVSQETLRDRPGEHWEAVDPHLTPAKAAELRDQVQHLINSLKDPDHRRIVELLSQGYKVPEVCIAVGCSQRTVFRVLKAAMQKGQLMNAAEEGGKEA